MPDSCPASLFVKDYYSIIRVKRFASLAEVRRSYRRLVQQYHPDVNPNPEAAVIIREVNEAYEVLGDENKKRAYDQLLINPMETSQPEAPQPRRHRDPYFNRRGYRPVRKEVSQYDLVVRYFHYVKKVCVSGLTVCFILLIDYNLPRKQKIVNIRTTYVAGRDYIVTEKKEIAILEHDIRPFENSKQVQLIETQLLSKTVEIKSLDGIHSITRFATVYGIFKFVPIIVFITAMICLFMPDNLEFRFGLCVLTGFALFFTLVLMYI